MLGTVAAAWTRSFLPHGPERVRARLPLPQAPAEEKHFVKILSAGDWQ
jgi:hypothetical protein